MTLRNKPSVSMVRRLLRLYLLPVQSCSTLQQWHSLVLLFDHADWQGWLGTDKGLVLRLTGKAWQILGNLCQVDIICHWPLPCVHLHKCYAAMRRTTLSPQGIAAIHMPYACQQMPTATILTMHQWLLCRIVRCLNINADIRVA